MRTQLLLVMLLGLFSGTASAEDNIIVGDPNACYLKIEYEAKDQMLHLRPTIPSAANCEITSLMVQAGLYQALDRHRHTNLRSIFLGRVADYRWLTDALVERSQCSSIQGGFWDPKKGESLEGDSNAFVAAILMDEFGRCGSMDRPPTLDAIEGVLTEQGYTMTGVSAEKVLLREMLQTDEWPGAGGKFPYDALIHLRIEKTP